MPAFYVFFDREIVEREKLDLSFLSPWSVSKVPGFKYMVSCLRAPEDRQYKNLDKDPRYVKAVASGN
ncbi:MAG: hypothetical protein J4400_02775 [Candidatus Aenigmarchaeota archaeon]|nr:hypothetical protein [Candidatus Aenigmarchaeota archaeon]